MLKNPPLNYTRIEEMAEGDEDFKTELIFAIHTSLLDLKTQYLEGAALKDEETIQMIRHKVKPTLSLFDMETLTSTINRGKKIIESQGFGPKFSIHLEQFLENVDEALDEVQIYMSASGNMK
jgi:hypothetical protein